MPFAPSVFLFSHRSAPALLLASAAALLTPGPARSTELTAELKALQFTTDHKLLRHNTSDILGGGARYPEVQWVPAARTNAPITHTGGQSVRCRVTILVSGADENVPFILQGKSEESALCFRGGGRLSGVRDTHVEMTGLAPLARSVRKLAGKIAWSLTLNPDEPRPTTLDLGSSGPHVIYVTLGTPRNAESPTGAVTDMRMELTVQRVAAACRASRYSSPPWLVYELMKQNGEHYLPARHYGLEQAWKVPESWKMNPPGASCISIVEFVGLLCQMIGIDGDTHVTAFHALADEPRQARRGGLGDSPVTKNGPAGEKWQLFLVDHSNSKHGQVGGIGGVNYYEATLVLDYQGKRFYYPGGTDRVFDSPNDVLKIFRTLAWAQWDASVQDWVVREVVHTYVRPGEKYPPSCTLP
ncbi:MAG: hypothetical protein K2R98_23380 [Gemmataceae bacterium]|nr:hypothetical protein [Gemmataceae bacterium]